jgi:putative endonuclease
MSTEKKELGAKGEQLACDYLIGKGYEVLERNWRFGKGELDIVARIGQELVIVEVKTRDTDFFGDPADFLSNRQQKMLVETADAFLRYRPHLNLEVRFDVMGIVLRPFGPPDIQHFEYAFYPTL